MLDSAGYAANDNQIPLINPFGMSGGGIFNCPSLVINFPTDADIGITFNSLGAPPEHSVFLFMAFNEVGIKTAWVNGGTNTIKSGEALVIISSKKGF